MPRGDMTNELDRGAPGPGDEHEQEPGFPPLPSFWESREAAVSPAPPTPPTPDWSAPSGPPIAGPSAFGGWPVVKEPLAFTGLPPGWDQPYALQEPEWPEDLARWGAFAQTEPKPKMPRSAVVTLFLTLCAAVAAIAVAIGSAGGKAQPATHSTVSISSSATPLAAARAINIHASDLGSGYRTEEPAPHISAPTSPSPCTPVSSKPWAADVYSPFFGPGQGEPFTAYSDVVVMRSLADANSAFSVVNTSDYEKNCGQPNFDEFVKRSLPSINQQSPCQFTFEGSNLSSLPHAQLPTGWSGFEYQAQLSCANSGESVNWYFDDVHIAVGRVLIATEFSGVGTPFPENLESPALNQMASRARIFTGEI